MMTSPFYYISLLAQPPSGYYTPYYSVKNNDKNSKFKTGDYVRTSKNKNIFAKGDKRNWSVEVLVIKKVENTVPCTYVIGHLNGEKIIGTFYQRVSKYKSNRVSG